MDAGLGREKGGGILDKSTVCGISEFLDRFEDLGDTTYLAVTKTTNKL